MTIGLAVSGAVVATGGAAGVLIWGSAAMPVIGATGLQVFAWGALAFDCSIVLGLPVFAGKDISAIQLFNS